MPARPFYQPSLDQRRLVRGVIVHDQVNVELGRHACFDLVEELAELGGAMAPVALANDPSGRNIEGGEQRCGTMPFVVMAPSGRLAGTHRQHRLTAVQRLDLRLLVHAENDGVLRRRDIKPHDIAHLGHEVWITREFKRLHPMGLQSKGPPDALHRRHRQSAALRHATGTPACGVLWKALKRLHDHRFNAGVVNRAWRPGAWLVMQPVHAPLHKTPTPFAYRRPVQPQLGRHFFVLTAFRAGQHDPGSQSQRLRRLPPHRQRRQFGTLSSLSISGASCWTAIADSIAVASILGTATRIYWIANLDLGHWQTNPLTSSLVR